MTTTSTPWSERARLELALRGVDKTLADEVLAEVEEHCADSGDAPEEAFGAPESFAEEVVEERMPVADRAHLDREGSTPFDAWSEVIARLGFTTLVAGVVVWFGKGLLIPLTTAGLTGAALFCTALTCVLYATNVARIIGRPRTVVPAVVATGLLVIAAACAFVLLPRDAIGTLPSPVLVAVGGALLWWGTTRTPDTRTTATPPAGTLEWLDDLRGLLEGRHDLSRLHAADLVRETAQHLTTTDRTPLEEFGPAEEYAVALARHQPRATPWWRRPTTRYWVLFGLAVSFVASAALGDQPTWYLVLTVLVLLGSGALLVGALRRR
jgi:hypothetical protein